jgi:hypothetical protein
MKKALELKSGAFFVHNAQKSFEKPINKAKFV